MDKLYLVIGSTGEYSSWTSWVVAAYYNKEMADLHCKLANEQAKGSEDVGYKDRADFVGKFYLDVSMQLQYTGTEYTTQEVAIVLHVDEYIEKFSKQ